MIAEYDQVAILSNPASTVLFVPYSFELLNKLHGKLFLSQVSSGLDNDRYTVPVC